MDAGASYIAKHSSTLRSVSLELCETSEDIWTLMADAFTRCMPQLQQLSIKMSPRWEASVRQALRLRDPSQPVLLLQRDQLYAIKACLRLISRRAPNLHVLSIIGDGILHMLSPSFLNLKHLILDFWESVLSMTCLSQLPQLKTLKVNTPVHRKWAVDLSALTNLEYFSVMHYIPSPVQLPGPCEMHVGNVSVFQWDSLTALGLPWLTRMEYSGSDGNLNVFCELLDLDLHLDELTMRFYNIGYADEPVAIAADSGHLLRQAKNVTLYARDINITIAPNVNLAWLKVHIVAERQLTLSYMDPEVLLVGRSFIMLQFAQTNIRNASVIWRPLAKRLGLSIKTSRSQADEQVVEMLCLSTGSKEEQKSMQAHCICHACMECLAYYDMLK